MRPTTDTRHLPVKLTEPELADKADELAKGVAEEEKLRGELAGWEAGVKETRKAKVGRVAIAHDDVLTLGEIVEYGLETREVPCTWLYTATAGYLRRDDTGELVSLRELRDDERQATIPGTATEVVQEPTIADLEAWSGADVLDPGFTGLDPDAPNNAGPWEIHMAAGGDAVKVADRAEAVAILEKAIMEHWNP